MSNEKSKTLLQPNVVVFDTVDGYIEGTDVIKSCFSTHKAKQS